MQPSFTGAGWGCNFRTQIPHLELSTTEVFRGWLHLDCNTTTTKRWNLLWGRWHRCLVDKTPPEQQISCRGGSEPFFQ